VEWQPPLDSLLSMVTQLSEIFVMETIKVPMPPFDSLPSTVKKLSWMFVIRVPNTPWVWEKAFVQAKL
jgi:hypothetical protein